MDSSAPAPPAKKAARTRSRAKTLETLRLAMLRVKNKGLKVTITAVAVEAGVTPALIHNTYPDLAEELRTLSRRSTRAQRDEMASRLAEANRSLQDLRAQLDAANRDIARLASIAESLRQSLAVKEGEVSGKVTTIASRRGK